MRSIEIWQSVIVGPQSVNRLLTSLGALLLFAAGAQVAPPAEAPSEPAATAAIAQVGQRSLSLADYQNFLLASRGLRDFEAFVDEASLREYARRESLELSYELVDAKVAEKIARLKSIYGDDIKALNQTLKARGLTVAEYERQERNRSIRELLVSKIAKHAEIEEKPEVVIAYVREQVEVKRFDPEAKLSAALQRR